MRPARLVVLPAVGPYDTLASAAALREFRAMLERRVDFERLARLAAEAGRSAAVLACLADDAELSSAAPFPDQPGLRGRQRSDRFVRQHLTTDLHVDPTRKQVAGHLVTWTVRTYRDDPADHVQGRAEAELRDGRVVTCGWAAER